MKCKRIFLLCLTLAILLSACTASQPAEEPAPEPEEVSSDPADQVKRIAEDRELWLTADPEQADGMLYAVTDLNENGRLELIATITEGTGLFSTIRFYEMNESFSGLEELEYTFGESHSEPDIGWFNSFRCYRGELGNFLVASDEQRNGYGENYYNQDVLVLQDGTVEVLTISYCMVLAEDSNGDGEPEMHAYYYSSGGGEEEELTSEAFASSVDDFFGYRYDRYVMDLKWVQFDAQERESEVDVPAKLLDSWKAFGFRKDMDTFEALFVAPSSYYDELYENGQKAPIEYGMESLTDYWQLTEISTELEARSAQDGNIDCHLIIGQDGMASFYYSDPADARGVFDLQDMPVAMASEGRGDLAEEAEASESVENAEPAESTENTEGTEAPGESGELLPVHGMDWMVVFATEDGLDRFEATIGPEDGLLYVTWYWWSEEEPGADPVITKLVFTNGVG